MQTSYMDSRVVEKKGLDDIIPFVKHYARDNWYRLAETPNEQIEFGDILARSKGWSESWIELKTEETFTGNLFLENWSNLDFDRRKAGWMWTKHCDILFYYFLDNKELYVINPFEELFRWFHGSVSRAEDGTFAADSQPRYAKYRWTPQKKCKQNNKTTGFIVPIRDVANDLGDSIKRFSLATKEYKQLVIPCSPP